jgi:integrase
MQVARSYFRLNVYDHIEEFCGWQPIEELIKYAGSQRNEMYLTCLFKTGGRAGEVLRLNTDNFVVDKRKKVLFCKNMKLEKRFKRIKREDGTVIREHVEAVRRKFPILLEESLTRELLEYLSASPEGPLFRSPYKSHESLTVSWGYKLIRKVNDGLPKPLFRALGLDVPFIVRGKKVAGVLHLWQHWFRSQRARQLREDYDFTESELMEYFSWLDMRTAIRYSAVGASKLAEKMRSKR